MNVYKYYKIQVIIKISKMCLTSNYPKVVEFLNSFYYSNYKLEHLDHFRCMGFDGKRRCLQSYEFSHFVIIHFGWFTPMYKEQRTVLSREK